MHVRSAPAQDKIIILALGNWLGKQGGSGTLFQSHPSHGHYTVLLSGALGGASGPWALLPSSSPVPVQDGTLADLNTATHFN